MQPINGISLERYAELGAAIDDVKDNREEVEKIITAEGVAIADWDAYAPSSLMRGQGCCCGRGLLIIQH